MVVRHRWSACLHAWRRVSSSCTVRAASGGTAPATHITRPTTWRISRSPRSDGASRDLRRGLTSPGYCLSARRIATTRRLTQSAQLRWMSNGSWISSPSHRGRKYTHMAVRQSILIIGGKKKIVQKTKALGLEVLYFQKPEKLDEASLAYVDHLELLDFEDRSVVVPAAQALFESRPFGYAISLTEPG